MRKTKRVAFCGILCALGVVSLLLGGITKVLDLTAVIIATILMFIAYEELKAYALLVYAATAILAFVMPIDITVAIEYLIFAIYPVMKPQLEKLPKSLSWAIKLAYMTISFVGLTLLLQFVLGSPDVWYVNVLFCLGGIVIFIIVDVMLTRLALYYKYKLRHQLGIDRLFK